MELEKVRGRPYRTFTERETGWSNADRGEGKGPCGRLQSSTCLLFQYALRTLSMGDAQV